MFVLQQPQMLYGILLFDQDLQLHLLLRLRTWIDAWTLGIRPCVSGSWGSRGLGFRLAPSTSHVGNLSFAAQRFVEANNSEA